MSKLIKSKKVAGISLWSMTTNYMPRGFEAKITQRLRFESLKLLLSARLDCYNGDAVRKFANQERARITSQLEDERAVHQIIAKNIASYHMAQLTTVETQINELEALLKDIDTQLSELSVND